MLSDQCEHAQVLVQDFQTETDFVIVMFVLYIFYMPIQISTRVHMQYANIIIHNIDLGCTELDAYPDMLMRHIHVYMRSTFNSMHFIVHTGRSHTHYVHIIQYTGIGLYFYQYEQPFGSSPAHCRHLHQH